MDALEREITTFIRRYARRPAPDKEFQALALKLFRFQFGANTLYRRFCQQQGAVPDALNDWREIPAMPALAFKELVLTTFPPRAKKKIFQTSGTVGLGRGPSTSSGRGAHYFRTLKIYEASIEPAFRTHVAERAFSYYFLMPNAAQAPHSSLSHMMKTVNARFARRKGKFYVKKGEPDFRALARDLASAKKPVLLLSTAFALKAFLDYLKEKRLTLELPKKSRLMETGGFKGRSTEISKKALYRLCAERLGVAPGECVSEYGMTELSSQYYSRALAPFQGPAWLRAQAIDPLTGKECARGQTGILKHVDLANIGSVMAVQTEDLGREVRGGFEFLGRAKNSEARGCSLAYERFVTA